MKRETAWRIGLVLAVLAPLVAGCGDSAKRALGWEKTTPDEFSVMTRAPLVQPPDFDLRPPGSTGKTAEATPTETARKVLVGPTGTSSSAAAKVNPELIGLSSGETALLKKAGAENVSGSVRKQIDEETTALAEESRSFTDDLLFWQAKVPPGEVIDPEKEAKRLEANASLGKSATEGDTPKIERRQRGWLEGIF